MHMSIKVSQIVRRVEIKRRDTSTSQAKVAHLLGINQGHLSKLLAGKANVTGK